MEKSIAVIRNIRLLKASAVILALVIFFSKGFAAEVSLVWDPSPDAAVVGYNLYWGTSSRNYTQKRVVGNVTSATVSNLTEGTTYYFAATAYDSWGIESDYSAEAVYTVPAAPVNQPPTLDSVANLTLPENNGEFTVNLAGISSGMVSGTPVLTVTAVSSNPGLIPNPAVSYFSPSSTATLKTAPIAFASGSATITVTVKNNSPTNSTTTKSFVVTVYPVNQSPTLAALNDVAVAEDSGTVTVNLQGISSGAANENQTLTVTTTSSNTGLIPAPTLNYTSPATAGSLTFRPKTNAYGSATITVTVKDGGLSNNVATRAFNVNVNPVNDTPTINPIENLSLAKGTGLRTITFSGVSSGATNEAQALTVVASSSNPSLIPNPTVSYTSPSSTGTLTFAPSSAAGSAVISVTVSDGAAENGTRTVSFNVQLNEAPTISDVSHLAIALGSNAPPVNFTVSDGDTALENLTVQAVSSDPTFVPSSGLVIQGTQSARTLLITPVAGRTGVCRITLTVSDGVASATDTFDFAVQKRPTPPGNISVVVVGQGMVSPSLAEGLVAGQSYTLLATPLQGQEFVGWSGSVVSSSPRITVTTTADMKLVANFVPSPYPAVAGAYYGLFSEAAGMRQESSGCFGIRTTSKGTYSGYVQIGTRKMPFVGKLALDCRATNVVTGPGGRPLTFTIGLISESGGYGVTGNLSDAFWVAEAKGQRATFTTLNVWAGRYTFVLPGQTEDPTLPFGHSYGTLQISASGLAKLAGKLADGSSFSRTCRITDAGALPLYVPLYLGSGCLFSWTEMEDRLADDLHGEAHWLMPAGLAATSFSAGFSYAGAIVGSKYVKPLGLTPCVSLVDNKALFSLEGQDFLRSIQVGTPLYQTNGVEALYIQFTQASGAFKGKFLDSATGTTASFGGVVLQKQNAGFGIARTLEAIGRTTLF